MRRKEEMEDYGKKTPKTTHERLKNTEFAGVFTAGPLVHSLTSSRTQELK